MDDAYEPTMTDLAEMTEAHDDGTDWRDALDASLVAMEAAEAKRLPLAA